MTVKYTDHLWRMLLNLISKHQALYETEYFDSSCAFSPSNECDTYKQSILTSTLLYRTSLQTLLNVMCETNVVTMAFTVRVHADGKGLAQSVV